MMGGNAVSGTVTNTKFIRVEIISCMVSLGEGDTSSSA